ncbi:MAG TPA: OsmC family peroxiredoxin, partial [Sphingopyxis sp.]|nr:OsmC family peroxiredoxin [Sphingopyxis sp.]
MAHGTATIGKDRYRTDIDVGGHRLVADEPPALGGGAVGPAPYDLLLASLGACTAITLRMYA